MIVDAGPLVAYVSKRDPHHRACLELLETYPGMLVVPALVIAEAARFIGTYGGADPELRFLGDLAAGTFRIEPVSAADWMRIAELVWRYRDLPLGTVDGSVVVAAERLGVTQIATLDRRHLDVVKPAHVDRFELLP